MAKKLTPSTNSFCKAYKDAQEAKLLEKLEIKTNKKEEDIKNV